MIIGLYLEKYKDIQKNITKTRKILEKFATNVNINEGLFDQKIYMDTNIKIYIHSTY